MCGYCLNQVWEIKGADLTISPNHTAAMGSIAPDRGTYLQTCVRIHGVCVCLVVSVFRSSADDFDQYIAAGVVTPQAYR